jgi:hypothetical protein
MPLDRPLYQGIEQKKTYPCPYQEGRNESLCSKLQGIIADFVLFYPLTLTLSPGRGKKGMTL